MDDQTINLLVRVYKRLYVLERGKPGWRGEAHNPLMAELLPVIRHEPRLSPGGKCEICETAPEYRHHPWHTREKVTSRVLSNASH
jgi:hypothetical protein